MFKKLTLDLQLGDFIPKGPKIYGLKMINLIDHIGIVIIKMGSKFHIVKYIACVGR